MSTLNLDVHKQFMLESLKQARIALEYGDVPVGAVLVLNGKIIVKAHNQVEKLQDSTAHAELLCIKKGIKKIGYKHLLKCNLYSTLEPCPMCAGAIVLARIPTLIYAAKDSKAGASESLYNITNDNRLNHRCNVITGVLAEESSSLLKIFFKDLRAHTAFNC